MRDCSCDHPTPASTRVWNDLGRYVTTAEQKVAVAANDLADRLYNAQVGLADAVYRREWDEVTCQERVLVE